MFTGGPWIYEVLMCNTHATGCWARDVAGRWRRCWWEQRRCAPSAGSTAPSSLPSGWHRPGHWKHRCLFLRNSSSRRSSSISISSIISSNVQFTNVYYILLLYRPATFATIYLWCLPVVYYHLLSLTGVYYHLLVFNIVYQCFPSLNS